MDILILEIYKQKQSFILFCAFDFVTGLLCFSFLFKIFSDIRTVNQFKTRTQSDKIRQVNDEYIMRQILKAQRKNY